MAFLTADEYKTLAQVSGSAQDDLIDALIPLVQDDIKALCNRDFAEGWPDAMKLYAAKMISYQITALTQADNSGMTSETQGGYSYTKSPSSIIGGYPQEIMNGLRKWRFISAKESNYLTEYRDQRWLSLVALAKGEALYVEPNSVYDEDLIDTI